MVTKIALIIFFAVVCISYFTGFKYADLIEAITAGIIAICLVIEGSPWYRV